MLVSDFGKDLLPNDETIVRVFDIEACEKKILSTVKRRTSKIEISLKLILHLNRRIIEKRLHLDIFSGDTRSSYVKLSRAFLPAELGTTSRMLNTTNSFLQEINMIEALKAFVSERTGAWQHVWRVDLRDNSITKLVIVNRNNLSVRDPNQEELNYYFDILDFRSFVNINATSPEISNLNKDNADLIEHIDNIFALDEKSKVQDRIKRYLARRSEIINSMDISKMYELWCESKSPKMRDDNDPIVLEAISRNVDSDLDFDLAYELSAELIKVYDRALRLKKEAMQRQRLAILSRV